MRRLLVGTLRLLFRNKVKAAVLLLIATGAVTVAWIPSLRDRAEGGWTKAAAWAGLAEPEQTDGTVYWCPMHPGVKRTDPNQPCPVCNMALVPLEGDASEGPPEQLTLTARQVQQAGVEYQSVVRRKLYREIDTTGRLDYDERRLAKITSWVRGKSRIDTLHVDFTGARVEKGELLAKLYSPELIIAQREYLLAQKNRSERFDLLGSARQKLLDQGMRPEEIDRLAETGEVQDRVPIHAPIGGTVIKRRVQEGEYVGEGDVLFEIADLSHLWLYADVYENELSLVHEGQEATISVSNFPGETFEGTVAFIDPMVQRDTRTVRVRIEAANPDRLLKPGMYARVQLRKQMGQKLAVPAGAVLWSGQRQVAIVRAGEGVFQPHEIRIDRTWAYPSTGGYQPGGKLEFGADRVRYHPVLAGLNPGEEVVTHGTFLLNAESQFQSVLTKMLPPQSESATLEEAVGAPLAEAIRNTLDAYFGLSGALAEDDLAAVPERAKAIHTTAAALADEAADTAEKPELAGQAERLAEVARGLASNKPEDLHAARVGFGRISRNLVDLLAENGGQTLLGQDVFVFRCGMAKVGYENWLWWSPEKHNPYMGRRMPKCGTRLSTLQPEAKK